MKYIICTFLLALLALSGCNTEQPPEKTDSIDSASLPDSEVIGATIYLYQRGQVTTKIAADRFLKFEAKDSTIGYVLDIDVLDSLGNVTSKVVGDSGIIREEAGLMKIYGHVVVVTDENRKLETEYLQWNQETDKVETDAFVRLTDVDGIVRGKGMIANRALSRVRILEQVSGVLVDSVLAE